MKDETGEFLLLGRGISRIDGQNYTWAERSAVREVFLHPSRPCPGAGNTPGRGSLPSEFEGLTRDDVAHLMIAVRDLFVINGLETVSPLTAAQRAGLEGKKVLFVARHFPGRAELIIELHEHFYAPLFEALSEDMMGENTIIDRLDRIVSHWFSMVNCDVQLALAFAHLNDRDDLRPGDAPLQRLMLRQKDLRHSVFTGLLAEGQMRGEVRSGNLDVMMTAIVGCYVGMLRTLSQSGRLLERGIYAQDILEETQRIILSSLHP